MKGGAYKRRGGLDGLIHADRALASMKGGTQERHDGMCGGTSPSSAPGLDEGQRTHTSAAIP